jgi:hypothetical protein
MNPSDLISKGFTYEPGKGWTKPPKAKGAGAVIVEPPVGLAGVTPKLSKDVSKLNKLERDWMGQLAFVKGVSHIYPQVITLKLADDCRYTPDFVVILDGKLVAYETKGFMRDDALVKLKVAARTFPWIDFILVTRKKGTWFQQLISP